MKTYGIWVNNKTGKRIAILDTVENEEGFKPSDYFAHVSTPERVGEIEVEDFDENLDDSFCCQSS